MQRFLLKCPKTYKVTWPIQQIANLIHIQYNSTDFYSLQLLYNKILILVIRCAVFIDTSMAASTMEVASLELMNK